ncbi:type VI secretion system-associated protein TagF [Bradyrhizobium sp.]|uniref:type VI secretion system-associated protein TagF n=1 Tax=Bradyrhizobium sp. TaxID=376 RepID=UPI0025BA19F7|nr:type VI secretion system-associated protein TagF [Bradyrhizobium sp.]
MRCGLFGKLGAKRDFIALATPRSFLEAWEPWVQASLSASRHQLGDRWQKAFLTAPLWRFWLGAGICGTTVAGVMMSSLDGMGRYYPLTLHAAAEPGAAISPPDADALEEWFGAAEKFVLSTLAQDVAFDDIASRLDALPAPPTRPCAAAEPGIVPLGDDMAGMVMAGTDFALALSALRAASPATYAAASFWWTVGGGDFPPLALSCRGLPDPYRYGALLTGDLGPAVHPT